MGSLSESTQELMEQRKRKRMISNRESARRSRQRKQKHLDELTAQLAQLRTENAQMVAALSITTEQYLSVEAENGVLRAWVMELSNRLLSLNEILGGMKLNGDDDDGMVMMSPWSFMDAGAVDMHQYC